MATGSHMNNRIERIEAMLLDEPRDTFLRYSLAMEYHKVGRSEESLQIMRGLVGDTPPYVPAFFMAAQHLAEDDQIASARDFLREGIEEARRQGDHHAAAEMSDFLASLGEHGE